MSLAGSHSAGVPDSGERMLRSGEGVTFSQTGAPQPSGLILTSLVLSFENASPNTYQLQLVLDPAQKLGARSVLPGGTLNMPPTERMVEAAFNVPVPAGPEIGLRVVRVLGAGALLGRVFASAEFSAQ
jgi:hypothetical protein